MTKYPVYYTTAYEIRIVKILCAFIAANRIILLLFTLNRVHAAGPGMIHVYIKELAAHKSLPQAPGLDICFVHPYHYPGGSNVEDWYGI